MEWCAGVLCFVATLPLLAFLGARFGYHQHRRAVLRRIAMRQRFGPVRNQ